MIVLKKKSGVIYFILVIFYIQRGSYKFFFKSGYFGY
jgi:hypothetical protein